MICEMNIFFVISNMPQIYLSKGLGLYLFRGVGTGDSANESRRVGVFRCLSIIINHNKLIYKHSNNEKNKHKSGYKFNMLYINMRQIY